MSPLPRALRHPGPGLLANLVGGLVACIIVAVFIWRGTSGPDLVALYTGLDMEEAEEVGRYLEERGVARAWVDSTASWAVPEDRVAALQMALAELGHPRSGFPTYPGASPVALQEVLESRLSSMDEVRRARVHLVVAGDGDAARVASVSAVLTLRGGDILSPSRGRAAAWLIAAMIPDGAETPVIVVDDEGELLASLGGGEPTGHASLLLRQRVETALETDVGALLDRLFGEGRSRVRAHVDLEPAGASPPRPLLNDRVRDLLGADTRLARMHLAIVVDSTRVVIDTAGVFREEARRQAEIDKAVGAALQVAGFLEDRGDEVTVGTLRFDKTQEVQAREQAVADERREFWTGIAINVAKVLGILAALITLRLIIQAIGRGVGLEGVGESVPAAMPLDVYLERTARLDEMTRELQTAHRMQMQLMPERPPQIGGFDVAGRCRPAQHVGGDFFQFLRRDDGRHFLCCVDVSGHGMAAAIPVVMFAGVLKSQVEGTPQVEELMARLNTAMHGAVAGQTLTRRTFVCMAGIELEPHTGAAWVVNTGCPFPYHYHADTDGVTELEIEGYPLGVRPASDYHTHGVAMAPGDCLVLLTDGLIEASDGQGNLYGFERMEYAVRHACADLSRAEDIVEHIFGEVESFTRGAEAEDDQTLIVVRAESTSHGAG